MVIIVFDFDDTLFATSHFYGKDPILCPELATSINQILHLAEQLGKVYIITNAEKDWLRLCLKRQIPDCKMLEKVIDAEDIVFSSVDNGISKDAVIPMWKHNAFHKKFADFQDGQRRELICFGDSPFDRHAALAIREKYSNVTVKNVLMANQPSLEHLLDQHKIIMRSMNFIVNYSGHLDLAMKVYMISSLSTKQKSVGDREDLSSKCHVPSAPPLDT